MKNVLLFLIFIALATFTYFYQELDERFKMLEQQNQGRFLAEKKWGEMRELHLPQVQIVKKGEKYFLKKTNLQVDSQQIQKVFEILGSLKIKREIKPEEKLDESHYFPKEKWQLSFVFEQGQMTLILGNKLTHDTTFYAQLITPDEKVLAIVEETSPIEAIYDQEDAHRSSARYRRLQTIMFLKDDFFYDRHVFLDVGNFVSAKIDSFRGRSYELNFLDETTNPAPLNEFKTFSTAFKEFQKNILELKSSEIKTNFDSNKLKGKLSTIFLETGDGRNFELILFKNYQEMGYTLYRKDLNRLYFLETESAKLFLSPLQSFWDKRIPLDGTNSLAITFPDKEKRSLHIQKNQEFSVQSEGQPIHHSFKKLFDFFSLQANRVSDFLPEDRPLIKNPYFTLEFQNEHFDVIIDRNELLVVNPSKKYKLHYWVGQDVPIGLRFADYFLEK